MRVCEQFSFKLGMAFAMFAVSTAYGQQTVLIGAANPLTGSLAAMGKDAENGARLAIEEINEKGLIIQGQRVTLRLVGKDDAADPRTATTVAQILVDEQVVAVVGHLNSGATIPASKVYSDAGITQVSGSTNPAYTLQRFKTTFRIAATDAQQGPALANYLVKNYNVKKVAIVDDATSYGQGLADEFERAIKASGVAVVSRDAISDRAVDFRAVLTKIKGENPDAIMFGGTDAGAGPFAKQAKQLSIASKIIGGDGICTEKISELAGDAVDNVICSQAGAPIEKMSDGRGFQAKYMKRFGMPIQGYAPYDYDAVYAIADAMKRARAIDKASILAEMPKTNLDGVTGKISFDSKGDLSHATISMYTYVSGKQKFLVDFKQ